MPIRTATIAVTLLLIALSTQVASAEISTDDSTKPFGADMADVLHLQAMGDEPIIAEFALGVGYGNLSIGGSDSALDDVGLLRWEPVLSIAPFQRIPQLRFGFACGIGLNLDNSSRVFISNGNGAVFVGSSTVPLWTLEPEFRLSWRQYFNTSHSFFVEPGIAVGALYAHLDVDNDTTGDSYSESDTTLTGRVFLNVGVRSGPGTAGLQASYMRGGTIDLADNANGDIEEYYIGVFGSIGF